MGNCQAVEAAALVIQYPSGKTERFYWCISANEVMKMNPGHYVSLIIPVDNKGEEKGVRFTRVKLLRSSETLMLGRAYRLVTTEEVMTVLREKSYEKMRRSRRYSDNNTPIDPVEGSDSRKLQWEKTSQSMRHDRNGQRPTPAKFAMSRSKSWCPSLQSISESISLQ